MKNLIIFFFILCPYFISAQWQWARHFGANSLNFPNDKPLSLINDGLNTYAIGVYGGTFYMPSDTLASNGVNECFITKFDLNGNQQWAKRFGSNYNSQIMFEFSVAEYDHLNNYIYLSGSVIGNAEFGGIQSNGNVNNGEDIFLAKMDVDGNFEWVRRGHGGGDNDYSRLYVNPFGTIYLVYHASDSIHFYTENIHIGGGGGLISYDSSGTNLSAQTIFHAFGSPLNYYNDVRLNFMGSDLVFYGSFQTDSFSLDTALFISNGQSDAFIARADSNGRVKWVKQFGFSEKDYIRSLALDDQNNIYVTGGFTDSISFNGNKLYNSGEDIFIAKLDSNGNYVWARSLACTGITLLGNSIISDGDGNTYITGEFSGTANFGSFQITATQSSDMFLARYNTSEDCLGVKHFGQAGWSFVVTDDNEDVYVTGTFTNSINIGGTGFTSYGGTDIFLAKADAITGMEQEKISQEELLIYANPSRGTCKVSIPQTLQQEKELVLR